MANLRDIRRRIKSVKNTAQITRAMQLVAASRMKKAQEQATSGRSYADLLNKVLVNLKEQTDEDQHPLLEDREGDRELVLVISTDKGLCGPLNTNVLRMVADEVGPDADFVTIGNKGRQSLSRSNRNLVADFPMKDPAGFAETKVVSKYLIEQFLSGKYDRVRVAFTNFINTIKQDAMIETLLPIRPIDLGRDKSFVGMSNESDAVDIDGEHPESGGSGYIFEPSPEKVLDTVVPQYVGNQVFQMILENRASEHSARMVAMKAATDNANDMIKDLTLDYNKQRQAAITSELLEITTAMKALE